MTDEKWNSVSGITEYLENGLEGLTAVVELRRALGPGLGPGLADFIVLGRWWLTRDAHCLWIEKRFTGWQPVVALETAKSVLADVRVRGSAAPLQPPDARCDVCRGLGFTLEQAAEATDHGSDAPGWRHPRCHLVASSAESRGYFGDIVKAAGFDPMLLNEIQNEYCDCSSCMPWQTLATPAGQIKIGWRKRVINIDWSATNVSLPELFASEDVSKGSYFVHAYGREKAVGYLRAILAAL